MTDFQREQYDSWCRDNLHDIEDGNISLKTNSQVVYFEAGKDMKVKQQYLPSQLLIASFTVQCNNSLQQTLIESKHYLKLGQLQFTFGRPHS